jgi:hypothetical protein
MKKKILIVLGVIVLLVAGVVAWTVFVGNKRSPQATVTHDQGGLDIKVVYCRPYKKERLIFGEKSAAALVPYGKYWRLGANAATEITFSKNVMFAGKPVSAGSYRMYAVPGASAWKVVLNSELGKWGAAEANHDKDVLTVEVPTQTGPSLEQFTISFADGRGGTEMVLAWDTTLVGVPLAAAT